MDNHEIIKLCSRNFENLGIDKYEIIINRTETTSINLNHNKIDLIKTNYHTNLYFTAIQDFKKVKIQISKIDRNNIEQTLNNLVEMMKYSESDTANDIAPFQATKSFSAGDQEPDLNKMYESINLFLESVKDQFPKIILGSTLLDYIKTINWFFNSNKVDFRESRGIYRFKTIFSSNGLEKTSSHNYSNYSTRKLDKELIACGSFLALLRQSNQQEEPKKLTSQFVGSVIISPDCLIELISLFVDTYLNDYPIITGTSIYKDHLLQPIAGSKFSLYSMPVSDDIEDGYFITRDGYEALNSAIIENGILKSYLLGLYGSLKTSKPRSVNDGNAYVVSAGDVSISSMIHSVKQGIILSRLTGDAPGQNGDFCGVAKNSYYVEDGEIKYPIEDVFISGNLGEMFKNITGISTERVNFGHALMPWIIFSGVTIHGNQ
jgi:PmbA protein